MTTFAPTPAPSASVIPSHGLAENVKTLAAVVALPNTLALNDIVNFFYLPPGAVIRSAVLRASVPLDSNGSPTLTIDVGDAALATRIFSASLVGSSASGSDGVPVFAALSFQFTAATLIFATIHAAGATKVAGSLYLRIDYVVEGMAS